MRGERKVRLLFLSQPNVSHGWQECNFPVHRVSPVFMPPLKEAALSFSFFPAFNNMIFLLSDSRSADSIVGGFHGDRRGGGARWVEGVSNTEEQRRPRRRRWAGRREEGDAEGGREGREGGSQKERKQILYSNICSIELQLYLCSQQTQEKPSHVQPKQTHGGLR